ncbi:hypothetical protein [Turneriella parva]|uniref:hypothetical protein n=1 Tax=Turneriella parva TaxID=29510 RepID=UPI0002E50CF5|nr:hypothetical protein [Turneriella parva]
MSKLENAESLYFANRQALRTWFVENHVEECLCFGFIDSAPRKISDARKWFLQRLGSAKTTATREKRMEFLMKLLDIEIKPAKLRLAFTKGILPDR